MNSPAYFLKTFQTGHFSSLVEQLNSEKLIKKSNIHFSYLTIEEKYLLVKLASMGIIKFDKETIRLIDIEFQS
uniref:hypothetical protein n=1 Tax=Fulvivirga sp. TaxID=1931237 RepID=UPI00404AFADB